jgi:hypothetical protein
MAPDKLLEGSSAASFITDEQLLQLVRVLGARASVAEIAGLANARLHDLH